MKRHCRGAVFLNSDEGCWTFLHAEDGDSNGCLCLDVTFLIINHCMIEKKQHSSLSLLIRMLMIILSFLLECQCQPYKL